MLWSRRRAAADASRATSEKQLAQSALHAAGIALLAWGKDGSAGATPQLAKLLDADINASSAWPAVMQAFDEEDGMALGAAVAELRRSGTTFATTLRLRSGRRQIKVTGSRIADDPAFRDLLVFQVATEAADLLRESRGEGSRLRALIDALPMPLWSRDERQRLIDCNSAYVEAVEAVSREEVLSQHKEFAETAGAGAARALALRARERGRLESLRQHIVVGGARRLFEITEAPIGEAGTGGYAFDVTQAEEAKEILSRQVAGHNQVLERLALAIMTVAPDGTIRSFNGAFAQLWKLKDAWLESSPPLADLLDRLRNDRMLPETGDFAALRQEWLDWLTGLVEPRQELLYLPNGMELWMVVSPHPLGGLLFTFEDVTDRRKLERSVDTLAAVQRDSIDCLFEGVGVFGEDGCLKLSNPALRRMWNLSEEFAATKPHIGILVERCRSLLPAGWPWDRFKARLVWRVTNRRLRQGRLRRPDDTSLNYALVPLPDGGVLLSMRDVSDSVRVQRALRERAEALEAADRLKAAFIANISYELRTPLNAIIGFAEILNNQYFGQLNQRQFEYTEGILEASQYLLTLINDILDLAVIEAGRMELDLEAVPVRALIDSVVQITGEWARGQQLRIETDCPAEVGAIRADERRMKHVLFNLVGNAIKFTPAHGRIAITARRHGEGVALAVEDTGIGIAPEDTERVFDTFVRGRDKGNRAAGAGLGLSLVRSLIELHGGTVELRSRPGHGTKVSCWLPSSASSEGTQEEIDAADERARRAVA